MYIYRIYNKLDNKSYIGKTKRHYSIRINEHFRKENNRHLNNAFEKYGKENFDYEILEECKTEEELNSKEIFYIEKYKENCYNFRSGGEGGSHSEETKLKISKSNCGKKLTEASLEKLKIAGKKASDKAKKKVICINNNEIFESTKACGKVLMLSPSSVAACCNKKISYVGKGLVFRFLDNYSKEEKIENIEIKRMVREVQCIETGEIFSSPSVAGKKIGIAGSIIANCCKGKLKTAYRGLHWKYVS